MSKTTTFLSKPSRLWTLATLVVIVAIGAAARDVARRAGSMQAAATPAATLLGAPVGSRVESVVRLERAVGDAAYDADILESVSGTSYRVTPTHIRVALASDTAVVMGANTDIKAGAVVQVSGAMEASHTVRASQIVILSGYVRITP